MRKKRKMGGTLLAVAMVFLGIGQSCKTDIDLTNVSDTVLLPGELTLPITKAEMTLKDILEKIEFNKDSSVEIVTDLERNEFEIWLKMDTTVMYRNNFNLAENTSPYTLEYGFQNQTAGDILQANQLVFATNKIDIDLAMDYNPVLDLIDSIDVRNFVIRLTVTGEGGIDLSKFAVVTKFPDSDITPNNGSVLEEKRTADATPADLNFRNFTIDMSQNQNHYSVLIELRVADGQRFTVGTGQKIKLTYHLESLDYESIYGKVRPNERFEQNEKTTFDIGMLQGFMFANPQLRIQAESNVGVYLGLQIDSVVAYNDNAPQNRIKAQFKYADGTTGQSLLVRSTNRAKRPGEIVRIISHDVNRDSVNLADLFTDINNTLPNTFEYGFSIQAVAQTSEGPNPPPYFITNLRDDTPNDPAAFLKVHTNAVIPFHFLGGSEMSYNNSLEELNFDELPTDIMPEKLYLVFTVENGLPCQFDFQLTNFRDSNDVDITPALAGGSTTFGKKLIKAPNVDNNGIVQGAPFTDRIIISLNANQYKKLLETRKIDYRVTINRADNKEIHFTPKDKISIKAGVYIKANITTDDIENLTNEN